MGVTEEITEIPEADIASTNVVDERTDEKETDVVETEAPLIKPAETYLVEEEITTNSPVEPNSAAATTETYLVEVETEEPEIKEEESAVDINSIAQEEKILSEEAPSTEEVLAIEPVSNSLEPKLVETVEEETVIQTKPSSGYWIEVSGDRDALVKYHG